jgi:hypothetical protein
MTTESLARIRKDIREAAKLLSDDEARYLVANYYMAQDARIRAAAQMRTMGEGAPNSAISWWWNEQDTMENEIKAFLDRYTMANPVGRWMRSITGVGPVIAAGILAHIRIEKAPTVGHIWAFAGLDPTKTWGKGEKRPWNADLKRLCWLLGESFVKVQSNEKDYYGKVYKARKEYETAKNERGDYAKLAQQTLETKRFGTDTEAYKWYIQGKLPPARIHLRSTRYAVKLFLAHLHEVWYEHHFKTKPPLPYPIAFLNHAHYIDVPNRRAA